MTEAEVIEYTTDALILTLVLSMPPIIVATIIGVLVSLVQGGHSDSGTNIGVCGKTCGYGTYIVCHCPLAGDGDLSLFYSGI